MVEIGTVRIRRARPADAPALAALAVAAYRHYEPRIGRPPAPMTADYAAAVAEHEVWIAESGGRAAGLLVLVDEGDHLLLDNVAVHPDNWGTGLGRRLLDLAEQRAQDLGRPEIRLYTNEAMTENVEYYPRRGYRETHRAEQDGFRRVFFAKTVAAEVIGVAVLDDYQGVAADYGSWSDLPARVDVTTFREPLGDEDAVARALADFAVVVAMRERTRFPAALLARLPKLRLLVTTGMRNAAIDMVAARGLGIDVCGTGGLGYPTAELTWGLILGLCREIPAESAGMRAGGWQTTVGVGLNGKTLGVLGLGRLGAQVARIGLAFGMDVIAWSQHLTAERCREVGARLVGKDELLAESDVLTVHLVLSDRTRGIIGAAELAGMKPTSYLVNTSRGPLVDRDALVEALRAKRIAGAALDVFDVEPLPAGDPLRAMDNVLLTPHLGYVTRENYRIFYSDAVADIDAYLRGEPVRLLNPADQ